MKIISENREFVDYLGDRFGVRVHRISCRPLIKDGEHWAEYDHDYSIPVVESMLSLPKQKMDSITALAMAVNDYEKPRHGDSDEDKTELGNLIRGWVDLKSLLGN
jgi:hypothetical protein